MGFRHGNRSLLSNDSSSSYSSSSYSSSINITVPLDQLCQPFCDPLNDSGFCLTPCLDYCPDVCRVSLLSYVPPPDDPPVTIYSPEVASRRSQDLSPFLITIFAAISAAFLVVCVYGALVWMRRRRMRMRAQEFLRRDIATRDDFLDEDRGPVIDHPIWYIRTIGLDASVINAIAVCRYKRGEGLIEGTECSVCLNEFQEDETLRLLPKCSHAFHVPCIDTWLRSHTNCPVCRAPVMADGQLRDLSPAPEGNPEAFISTRDVVGREAMEDDVVDSSSRAGGPPLEEGRKIRRSASVDSLSPTEIVVAAANVSSEANSVSGIKNSNLNRNLVRLTSHNVSLLASSSSNGRFIMHGGCSSIRRSRSLSWSGRFLSTTARNSRNRGMILPL